MRILVVGSGGREHALCWKIAQSPLVSQVYCAPGNGGIEAMAECIDIPFDDIGGLRNFAAENRIDLTVVGPEGPICAGLVDEFLEAGLKAFGPNKSAAEIEGSKSFARELCRRHRIPSPGFWIFDEPIKAHAFLEYREDAPIVIKASGLAAGKGVTVAMDHDQAREAIRDCMERSRFGQAGRTVVLEEFLEGRELSVMTLTDGRTIIPFEPARDHKPVFDGNEGPNTGGMGAVSPPELGSRTLAQIEDQVLFGAVHAMNREKRKFSGFLYAGLMLTQTGPRVLEFNCRLGDPETQPLMMRLNSDLVPYLSNTVEGTLDQLEAPQWDPRPAVAVVATSKGYPGEYPVGLPIHGLDDVKLGKDLQIFHSGTRIKGGDTVTAGGRVLTVCALGDTMAEARSRAYGALENLDFQGMHYRTDIGAD
jgi:phosphoribosylamine--glycine ligase